MATDEEVAAARQSVEEKRAALAAVELDRAAEAAGLSNDITLAQLQREEASLDQQIAAAKADAEAAAPVSVLGTIADRQDGLAAAAAAAPPAVQRAHRQEASADADAAQAAKAEGSN